MRTLLTAIFIDPFGCLAKTPEEEAEELAKDFSELLKPAKLDVYKAVHPGEIKPGTDLVLFDYGGMNFGNSLMEDNSRAILKWAQDNPSALVVVTSTFTYDRAIRYLIEDEMGLKAPDSYSITYEGNEQPVHNVVVRHFGSMKFENESQGIPKWFVDWATEKRTSGLPAQVFFKPRRKFLTFMTKNFARKNVIDVGAGVGHVAKALKETNRFKVVAAIDLLQRDVSQFPVYVTDARTFPYPPRCVVLICRPCHGSFVEETVRKAMECKVTAIVYVGLAKNVKSDLGEFNKKFNKVAEKVGDDGENLWLWRK